MPRSQISGMNFSCTTCRQKDASHRGGGHVYRKLFFRVSIGSRKLYQTGMASKCHLARRVKCHSIKATHKHTHTYSLKDLRQYSQINVNTNSCSQNQMNGN